MSGERGDRPRIRGEGEVIQAIGTRFRASLGPAAPRLGAHPAGRSDPNRRVSGEHDGTDPEPTGWTGGLRTGG